MKFDVNFIRLVAFMNSCSQFLMDFNVGTDFG